MNILLFAVMPVTQDAVVIESYLSARPTLEPGGEVCLLDVAMRRLANRPASLLFALAAQLGSPVPHDTVTTALTAIRHKLWRRRVAALAERAGYTRSSAA